MCFYRYKGVEGVSLMSESLKLTIHSMYIVMFYVAVRGLFQHLKQNIRITGSDEVLCLK